MAKDSSRKGTRWTGGEETILRELNRRGMIHIHYAREVEAALPGRSYQSAYSRLLRMGLSQNPGQTKPPRPKPLGLTGCPEEARATSKAAHWPRPAGMTPTQIRWAKRHKADPQARVILGWAEGRV